MASLLDDRKFRPRLRVCAVLLVALAAGCVSLSPTYDEMVAAAASRTSRLRERELTDLPLNRAARMPHHSQAAIKPELESLWQPTLRPRALVNHCGLLATRYSQLNTNPPRVFRHGTLTVEHLGRPTEVPYIAAIHHGERLPLVIGVSGINGTVDGKFTLDILEHLYRTGKFHVIHLESITSIAHCTRNNRPFAGGFPEGLLLYDIVRELRDQSGFAEQIEQVHLVGVSFGGLLCGFAAHCEGVFQTGVVDGAVLVFSTPLDLKLLFDNLQTNRLIYERVHQGYLLEGSKRFLKQAAPWLSDTDRDELDFDRYMRKVALPYVQRVYPELKAKFPDLPPIADPDDLYAFSSLRPFVGQLGVPFFVVHAYDDPVILPADHIFRLIIPHGSPLVEGLLVTDGGHLGFDAACGYPFTARVAEQYFRYWSADLRR